MNDTEALERLMKFFYWFDNHLYYDIGVPKWIEFKAIETNDGSPLKFRSINSSDPELEDYLWRRFQ